MIKDSISYSTIEQQIEKLKSQNLIINDEQFAKDSLRLFGYSNLIKSYREPYVVISGDKKLYRSGVSFEQLCSLYTLDKNIRNNVMAAMLDLEEHIKEIAADVIAQSFGVHQDQYLVYRNYQNRKKHKYRFTLPGILDVMKKSLDTDKEPIHHYQTEHGIVPPWILFKSIYFSTITNFIDLFKAEEQEKTVRLLYDTQNLNLSLESIRKLMMDTLYICLEYRNLSAHGGRVYNYICKKQLRTEEIFGKPAPFSLSGFSQLLTLLSLFIYQNPFLRLQSTIETEVARHCEDFPQDVTYLGQVLNMNIVPRHVVWISEGSNKYHSHEYCSGMKNAIEVELDEAEKHGYVPCKKCCK
ncbi:Abi family protein [Mediterraneibacter gnavus]|uniref:Abi family protein n=1 Tax=Mediterraneibacter gnavus TaxID=33038 RepID=UPI00232BE6E1|nr:Abi family protein [Mediterraneibacter gnavus]MDB8712007.1 Abi family protein [Mediterraneibacter gnavus]MDB8715044.1 Abi family protein [Mediterraneibacter gnavus]